MMKHREPPAFTIPSSVDAAEPAVPGGTVAGAEIVRELTGELALPVWHTLRSVLIWASEPVTGRATLFEPGSMARWERELLADTFDADLRLPLAVLAAEMADPGEAPPHRVAWTCLCVVEWALAKRAPSTGLAFAEAAALAWPEHPRYAWTVGRLLRTHGKLREAEAWLNRAVRLAQACGDWEARVLALNTLGNVFHARGDNPEALRHLQTALRMARKHGLRKLTGEVLHDLFVITAQAGRVAAAERYAAEAFEIYRAGHERLPALAHDVAFAWLTAGYFRRALTVLQQLPGHFSEIHDRVRVTANAARAAAACQERALFEEWSAQVWSMAEESLSGRGIATALVEVAVGATTLGEWNAAERALARAGELAALREEADVTTRVEEILGRVRERRGAERERQPADLTRQPSGATLEGGFALTLRDQLATTGV